MATNDPNKPDNVTYIDPGNKTPEAGGEAPAPEMTAEETAALSEEGEKALHDIGEEQLEPPAPFDMGGEHMLQMIGPAFENAAPGLNATDWLVGIIGAVVIRLVVYQKSKKAENSEGMWNTDRRAGERRKTSNRL